jgi:hypothetical protein
MPNSTLMRCQGETYPVARIFDPQIQVGNPPKIKNPLSLVTIVKLAGFISAILEHTHE